MPWKVAYDGGSSLAGRLWFYTGERGFFLKFTLLGGDLLCSQRCERTVNSRACCFVLTIKLILCSVLESRYDMHVDPKIYHSCIWLEYTGIWCFSKQFCVVLKLELRIYSYWWHNKWSVVKVF